MQPEVGKIYEGKVSGITGFGAFVDLEDNVTGMVHISEISSSFVKKIDDVLSVGDTVKVKVIGINEKGKVSLSIKQAKDKNTGNNTSGGKNHGQANRKKPQQPSAPLSKEAAFEDMMNKFKQSSDEKMSDIKKNMEGKRRNTSRKRNG